MNSLLAAAAALTTTVLLASGCASTDAAATPTAGAPATELVYRTGSHIAVRERVTTKEEQDKRAEEAQRTVQQMQTTGAGNPKN